MASRSDVPAVRILPMSDKPDGFRGKSIAQVQTDFFLARLPARGGRYEYPLAGLNTPAGTVVLFQFQARVVASAIFLRDVKRDTPAHGVAGTMYFDPATIRTFEPWDADAMRRVWPGFRAFGHVKQILNAGRYPRFDRLLKRVISPAGI